MRDPSLLPLLLTTHRSLNPSLAYSAATKKAAAKKPESSDDSSSDDDSSDEEAPVAKKAVPAAKAKAAAPAPAAESSSDESSDDDEPAPVKATVPSTKRKAASSDSDSSSSADDDEEETAPAVAPAPKKQKLLPVAAVAPATPSGYDSTASASASGYDSPMNGQNGEKKKRVANAPFRRVKAETVEFLDERLRDNSFQARVSRLRSFLFLVFVGDGGRVVWIFTDFALFASPS